MPCLVILLTAALAAIGYFSLSFFNALALYNIRREHSHFSNSHTYSQLPQHQLQNQNQNQNQTQQRARGSSAARSVHPDPGNANPLTPQPSSTPLRGQAIANQPATTRKKPVPQLYIWLHRCFIGAGIFYGLDQIVAFVSFGRATDISYEQQKNWRIVSLALTNIADSCFSFASILFSFYYMVKAAFAAGGLLMPGDPDHPRLRVLRALLIGLGVFILVVATTTPNVMCVFADKHAWVGYKNLAHGIVLFTAEIINSTYTLDVFLSARAHDRRMTQAGLYGGNVKRGFISQSNLEAGKGGVPSVKDDLNIKSGNNSSSINRPSVELHPVSDKLHSYLMTQVWMHVVTLGLASAEVLFFIMQFPDKDKPCVLPFDTCAFPIGYYMIVLVLLFVFCFITWLMMTRPRAEERGESVDEQRDGSKRASKDASKRGSGESCSQIFPKQGTEGKEAKNVR